MQIGDTQWWLGALLQTWQVLELRSALFETFIEGADSFQGSFGALFHRSALHYAFRVGQIVLFTL